MFVWEAWAELILINFTFSASSNALRKFDSDSPANFDIISGPLIKKKDAPVSFATARAIRVLPKKQTNYFF